MGIFNQLSQSSTPTRNKTIISSGSNFVGELILKCDLHIDGRLEGNIFSDNNVTVGTGGEIFGFISANHVIVSGRFQGQIDCAILEVLSTGEVHGDINTREMRLESGSRFYGHSYDSHQKNFLNILPKEITEKLENYKSITLEAREVSSEKLPINKAKQKNEKS